MDPQTVFCPNLACPASGHVGKGNIGVHSRKEQRFKCHVCGKTLAETKGTVFYRLRTPQDVVVLVVAHNSAPLLAHGCPLQAIVAAFGLDERTVLSWQARSGRHCQRGREELDAELAGQPLDRQRREGGGRPRAEKEVRS